MGAAQGYEGCARLWERGLACLGPRMVCGFVLCKGGNNLCMGHGLGVVARWRNTEVHVHQRINSTRIKRFGDCGMWE